MHIAVILPFRGDPAVLHWTLDGFARQELPTDVILEVRICGDGVPVPALPPSTQHIAFNAVHSPRVGISQAKNLLLEGKPADIAIFANADTRPVPAFVQAHAARLASLPARSMVLGASPYEKPSAPKVFDALKEETPMIFFYSQLAPHRGYDFRHAWNLNVSVRYGELASLAAGDGRATGGGGFFNPLLRPYGYEDLDLAFRLMGPDHPGVYFDPAAQVLHRHPMTFDDYLNREELLGMMAPVLHGANPALSARLHGTLDLELLTAQYRAWIDLDRPSHAWIYKRLQEWNTLPDEALPETGSQERQRLLMTLYQMHIPLKRLAFRLGFLHGLTIPDARWQERRARGLWQEALSRDDPRRARDNEFPPNSGKRFLTGAAWKNASQTRSQSPAAGTCSAPVP